MSICRFNGDTVGRVILALFVVVTAWAVQSPAYAQDYVNYPEDRFYELLDEQEPKHTLDEARAIVAGEFDEYDAAEIAAYLCSPDPVAACEGSLVWITWEMFLYGLLADQSVDEILGQMIEWDETLAIAIASYWCSPPAGKGCEADENNQSEYDYDERESFFSSENEVKERPASREDVGAQFFGGDNKNCSRSRSRRC